MISSVASHRAGALVLAIAAIVFLPEIAVSAKTSPDFSTATPVSIATAEPVYVRIAEQKLKSQTTPTAKWHSTKKTNKLQSATPCIRDENGKLICPPKL